MPGPSHSSAAFMEGAPSQPQSLKFPSAQAAAAALAAASAHKTRFGYLFDYEPGERLEPGEKTVFFLKELGAAMREKFIDESTIPSAYTYFGQFIAHDITFDPITKDHPLLETVEPLDPMIVNALPSLRSGLLDLDSVYGPGINKAGTFPVPLTGANNAEMKLGVAYRLPPAPEGTDVRRDVRPPFAALIGDPRNDENVPLSQLHLAFLKGHNRLVQNSNLSFQQAQDLLKRRYQNLVVNDFLPRLVHSDDLEVAKAKIENEKNPYSPKDGDFFIPIEFTAAAFRFGHSMIRSEYFFNATHETASLTDLFTPAAMATYPALLAEWIIDWTNFIETGKNKARTFLPQLVEPLAELIDKNLKFSLAANDLLRGYLFGLPTGQALAKRLGVKHLSPSEVIENALDGKQKEILHDSGFDKATPLWFYLFVEARHWQKGQFLGPCCGQLIALVLLELARRSNYQDDEPWDETLGKKNTFNLSEFLMHTLL